MSSGMGDQRNWLEKLGDKIPGYSGYADRERRRDIDKLHREHMADRLRALKAPLMDLIREMTSTGRLLEVGPLDLVTKKVDHLENRVRFASYGYSGFFDVVKVEQQQLEAMYRVDLGLVEHIDQLESKVRDLKGRASTADGLKTASAQVAAAVDATDRAFDERHRAINTFDQSAVPGRPLFS